MSPVASHFERRAPRAVRHGNPREHARQDLIRWCRAHRLPVPAEVAARTARA